MSTRISSLDPPFEAPFGTLLSGLMCRTLEATARFEIDERLQRRTMERMECEPLQMLIDTKHVREDLFAWGLYIYGSVTISFFFVHAAYDVYLCSMSLY